MKADKLLSRGRLACAAVTALVVLGAAHSAVAQISGCDIEVRVGFSSEIGGLQIDLQYDRAAGFILREVEPTPSARP